MQIFLSKTCCKNHAKLSYALVFLLGHWDGGLNKRKTRLRKSLAGRLESWELSLASKATTL